MKIPSNIDRQLGEDDRKIFLAAYKDSRWLRELLLSELKHRTFSNVKESESKDSLNRPNYAVTQAYLNGQRQGWREAMQLLTLDDPEETKE